jgi:hypothetical protein
LSGNRRIVQRGTVRFLHSWSAWLGGLLGAAYGFFFFYYPQKSAGTPFWAASGTPNWLVATFITAINAAAPLLVVWLVMIFLEARAPEESPNDQP